MGEMFGGDEEVFFQSDAPTSYDLSDVLTDQDWADIEEAADRLAEDNK